MRRMRLAPVLLFLVLAASLWTACGKKSSPTAPPANPPVCTVRPTSLDFGIVPLGHGSDLSLSVTNTGGGTLVGTLIDTSTAFTIFGDPSYSLAAGQGAGFTVSFAPLREGSQSASIRVGADGSQTVICTGTTPSAPECQVRVLSPSLDAGAVEIYSSKDIQISLTNAGGGMLVGTVTSPKADFKVVGSPSYSLSASQSATFTVRFTPTKVDTQTCLVNTGSPQCGSFVIAGTGTRPPGEQFANLDFGRVAIGQSAERTFTVYTAACGTNPYGVCAITPLEARFWVDGSSVGAIHYRCDLNHDVTFPRTYTATFVPLAAGTQHCVITFQCESVEYAGYTTFGYATCTGVGY